VTFCKESTAVLTYYISDCFFYFFISIYILLAKLRSNGNFFFAMFILGKVVNFDYGNFDFKKVNFENGNFEFEFNFELDLEGVGAGVGGDC
jgi:hypothetical protein